MTLSAETQPRIAAGRLLDEDICTEAIAALDVELELLTERRRLLADLRATFHRADAVVIAEPPLAPTVKPAKPKANATRKVTRSGSIDYREVANAMRDAERDHRPAVPLLMERFGVPESTAKNWPGKVRKLGLLSSAAAAPVLTVAPSANGSPHLRVLMCDDCDAEFPSDGAGQLNQHCIKIHGRRPSTAERTPVPKGGAA